jgi:hypothetical protein
VEPDENGAGQSHTDEADERGGHCVSMTGSRDF